MYVCACACTYARVRAQVCLFCECGARASTCEGDDAAFCVLVPRVTCDPVSITAVCALSRGGNLSIIQGVDSQREEPRVAPPEAARVPFTSVTVCMLYHCQQGNHVRGL